MSESTSKDPESSGLEKLGLLRRLSHRDHTRGSLYGSLLTLALPLVATSLFSGVVFQVVDLKLVSGLGSQALTAVVVTNQSLRQLFFMLLMGGSFGAQSLIARAVGGGDSNAADHVAGQTILVGVWLSLLAACIGLAIPREMLEVMNVSPEVLEIGVPYVRLVFVLSFGFIFMNFFSAILNGAGDTTTPLLIAVVSTTTSLLAEWALIYGHFGSPALGIRGVALGVGTGQVLAIFLMAYVLFGGASRVHVRRGHMHPNAKLLRQLGKLAWPPGLQMIGGFLVTVFFIRIMGDFGDKAQTAYSIGLRLSMLAPMISFPLAGAVATLVGQALGSANVPRAWQAIRAGLLIHVALMWTFAALLFFFRQSLLEVFSQDPDVIAIGEEMLAWQAGTYLLLAFSFVFMRALQGAGDVLVPMCIALATSVLITVPLGLYLSRSLGMGPKGLFMAQFITSVLGTTLTGLWLATGRWTRVHLTTRGSPPAPSR